MKIMLRTLVGLSLMLGIAGTALGQSVTAPTSPQAARPRRVNVPYFSGAVDESQSAIFWFGVNQWYQNIPSHNYVDVRIAYSPAGLHWRATGIDYYLWYKENATASDDLTRYDALALYIDTGHDHATLPQTDDYYFLVGLHGDGEGENTPQYRRQARGTGSGWDAAVISSAAWSDYSGWQWSDNGPNDNSGNIDFGWVMGGTIPWSTFGLAGPPANGTVWGFGVLQYDQDQASGPPLQEIWPETFNLSQPNTWGELHFGSASYTPQPAVRQGSAMIRSATPEDNTVEDSWMGGGGWCQAGHEGHSEDNHGNDQALYVGSEIQPTHFPCFNKSYLRFSLASVPANKVILSATLTLHHWGGASYDPFYTISYVWLSSVTDPWDEMTIHWNNAPLAQENLSMTPIPPKTTPLVWPGDAYSWDATQAVAEAYASGQSVSFAMYDSTTGRDSSKYLTASEVGLGDGTPNWDIEGRPRLDVVWGDPVAALTKHAVPARVMQGDVITYSLSLLGAGQTLALTDTLPSALSHPLTMTATFGAPQYNGATRQLTWSAAPGTGQPVTITYAVTATVGGPLAVSNTATLSAPGGSPSTSTAWVIVDGYGVWLPLIKR